jgi:hypothetical protein
MGIDQCRLIDLPKILDARGNLTFIESGRHMPFEFKRVYYLYDVPGGSERGGHAHKSLHQFHLNRSYYGLYIPPMVWRELDNFSSGSVALALASEFYEEDEYIRDHAAFLEALRKAG